MNEKNKIIRKITNALNANKIDVARKIVENNLKKLSYKDEYYFYSALLTDDLLKKLDLYTKAIEINPNFMDAYINRGLVNNELGNYEQSILDYDRAIELDSKCSLAYNNRGYTKYKQKKYESALMDYNKAILLNPKFQMALDNKAKLFQEVCMKDDNDFSEKYYISLGISELNLGNYIEAIKNFDEALMYNQNLEIAFFYKGIAFHNLGNTDEAYQCYTKAISINGSMVDAYFNRGQLLFRVNPKEALDDFVAAVALDSKFIDAYYSIAVIQKNLGQYDDALKNLDKIIEIEPNAINAKALKKLILTKYKK